MNDDSAINHAVVSAMGMCRQHNFDRLIELSCDIKDRAARIAARVVAAVGVTTLMHDCDDCFYALRSKFPCILIDRL